VMLKRHASGGIAYGSEIHPRADENLQSLPLTRGEVRWGLSDRIFREGIMSIRSVASRLVCGHYRRSIAAGVLVCMLTGIAGGSCDRLHERHRAQREHHLRL